MSLTSLERETVVTMNDAEDHAEVYTAQRPIITKLKRNPAATLIEEGKHEGSAWARFEVPKTLISFRSAKRVGRKLSDEERAVQADRLRVAREAR